MISATSKVYRLPDKQESNGAASRLTEELKLGFRMIEHDELTDVGKTTRVALRDALVSRHCGRVWDSNTADSRPDEVAFWP